MTALPRVFVSMGTPYTEKYTRFREELERTLRDRCHVDPRIIGRNEYPPGSPIEAILDVMKTCSGVIIVAYERKMVVSGVEKRGGGKNETPLANQTYTTPWNHIESALAYGLKLPIRIIAENGLKEEGLIESKNDWYVQYMDFEPQDFHRPEVYESLMSWVNKKVLPRAQAGSSPLTRFLRVGFNELNAAEWRTLAWYAGGVFAIGGIFGALIRPLLHLP